MNVNTLENSPSIGYFFAVCGPTIALVIVVWWLVKNENLQVCKLAITAQPRSVRQN